MDVVDRPNECVAGGERYAPADRAEEITSAPLTDSQIERLKQLEHAASIFYSCPDPEQRDNAHRFLLEFRAEAAADVAVIPALLHLIEANPANDAIVFSCATLREVVQINSDKILPAQCNFIRDVLLKSLFNLISSSRPNYVVTALIRSISYIIKTGWKSYYPDHHCVVSLTASLTDSPNSTRRHACAALQLLSDIVTDIQPEIGTFDHFQRAMAIMFKEQQLERILQLGLSALQSTIASDLKSFDRSSLPLTESALRLILSCLQYDFPATGYAPMQSLNQPLLVPSGWKFLKSEDTILLFFNAISCIPVDVPSEAISLSIQCLSWLVTLKRSMFASHSERRSFLKIFMEGVTQLIREPVNGQILDGSENQVFLAKLIDSMRATFPFSDILLAENAFDSWIDALHHFTTTSIHQDFACKQYLVNAWSALISASMKHSAALQSQAETSDVAARLQRMNQLSFTVVTCFLDSQLSRSSLDEDEDDDILNLDLSEGIAGLSLPPLLRSLSVIIRAHSCAFSSFVLSRFNELLQSSSMNTEAMFCRVRVLTDMVTCCIGNRGNWGTASQLSSAVIAQLNPIEAQLCGHVFAVIKQAGQLGPTSVSLELSFLLFLTEIHRLITYDSNPSGASSGASLLHGLIPYVPIPTEALEEQPDGQDGQFSRLLITLLDTMVIKVSHNLSVWSSSPLRRSHLVIGASLSLLDSLAYGVRILFNSSNQQMAPLVYGIPKVFSNGKILLQSPFVRHLLRSAETDTSEQKWPFLTLPSFKKHRTAFFTTLSRLFFLQEDHLIETHWNAFTSSISKCAETIREGMNQNNSSQIQSLAVGWLCDLRGIVRATNRTFTYNLVLEWIVSNITSLLIQLSSRYSSDIKLTYHVLRLFSELMDNSLKRIQFERSDATPITVFKDVAAIILNFSSMQPAHRLKLAQIRLEDEESDEDDDDVAGANQSAVATPGDEQKWSRYRCQIQCLLLYDDSSVNAVYATMQMALAIPLNDLVCYPKLEEVVFPFIEAFCMQFPLEFIKFDDDKFRVAFHLLKHSIINYNSVKPHLAACSFSAISSITNFLLHVSALPKLARLGGTSNVSPSDKKLFAHHITSCCDQYVEFLSLSIDFILQASSCDKFGIASPIFNILLLFPQEAVSAITSQLASHFCDPQSPEIQLIRSSLFSMLNSVFVPSTATSNVQSLQFLNEGFSFFVDEEAFLNTSSSDDSVPSPRMDQDRITIDDNTPPEANISDFLVANVQSKGRGLGPARNRVADLMPRALRIRMLAIKSGYNARSFSFLLSEPSPMLDVDIVEILEDHAYLGAVSNNDSDSALELLEQLPAFNTLIDYVSKLKASNELRFDVIFHEAIGHYLFKCFLVSEYSASKSYFISDVEVYRQMGDGNARLSIAKKIASEFLCATNDTTSAVKRASVFGAIPDCSPSRRRSLLYSKASPSILEEQGDLMHKNDTTDANQASGHIPRSGIRPASKLQSETRTISPKPYEVVVTPTMHLVPPHQSSGLTSLLSASTNAIGVYGHMVAEAFNKINAGDAQPNLFDEIGRVVLHDLEYDVFPRFLQSPFFEKYIRAKCYVNKEVTIDDFLMMRILGRGGFGTVRATSKTDTGTMYAAKIISKKSVQGTNSLKYILRERDLLASVHSAFVIGLNYAIEDKNNLYFMLDLMTGGDLRFQLNQETKFTEVRARYHAAEVLLGLEHIHMKDIIFRDLKLENVLVDDKGHCKISDLGLAVVAKTPIKGYAGTPGYIAPEVILEQAYTKVADFFSFGVMVYRMIAGKAPFDEKIPGGEADRDKCVVNGIPQFTQEEFSPEAVSLLSGLLEKDPTKRLGADNIEQIKSHPWFKSIDWGLLEAGHIPPPCVPATDRVNAESRQDIPSCNDDEKYKKVKLTIDFTEQLKTFPYKSPVAIQNEITEIMMRADQGINFEKFAPPPPPRIKKKQTSSCTVM